MIGVPPIGTVGIKPPMVRDMAKPKPIVKPDPEEVAKIAWADKMADAPVMLMGRAANGRFVSLKDSNA